MFRSTLTWAFIALVVVGCDAGEIDDPLDDNTDPVAVISAESAGERGSVVELDASGSHDADGDALTFSWSLTSRPSGSSASITGATQEIASFVPDVTGTYTVQLTVSDGDADHSTTQNIVIDVQTLRSISSDSVIPNTNSPAGEADYRVADNSSVTFSADVTIEPGVTIRMGSGSIIHVPTGGSLRAVGTAAASIRFVGANNATGYWAGLDVDSNNSLNELAFVDVANGGGFGYADLYLTGTMKVSNSTFRDSETFGIHAGSGAQLPAFAGNTFHGNVLGAMEISPQLIGSLDGGSDYAGSVAVRSGTASGTQNWPSINTNYRIADNASVNFSSSTVTIEPGARFVMGEGSIIHVPTGSSFSAVGTATDSIRFVGSNDIDGHWAGLDIDSNNSANRLSHVLVANAGAFGYAGLYLTGTAQVDNSHFRDSQTFGLHATSSALLPGFASNRFTGNVQGPVEIPVDLMGSLDALSVYGGNDVDFISVAGGSSGTAQTWPKTDVPFFLNHNASANLNSAISIDPGFRLHAGEGSIIHVPAGGSISATGTAADSIVFRGASATPGYWAGIDIDSNAANTMSYVRIGHGGAFGYSNIYLTGTLAISNSHIHDSSRYGVDVTSSGTYVASNVTYSGNALGDVN